MSGIIARRYPRAIRVTERAIPPTVEGNRQIIAAAREVVPPEVITLALVALGRDRGSYERYLAAAAWREAFRGEAP